MMNKIMTTTIITHLIIKHEIPNASIKTLMRWSQRTVNSAHLEWIQAKADANRSTVVIQVYVGLAWLHFAPADGRSILEEAFVQDQLHGLEIDITVENGIKSIRKFDIWQT